jgi:peptidoglycan/LPS O-acetylase OafA/YrhL
MSFLKLNPDYSNRTYGLDVFRAVAIILVVISHGAFIVNLFAPGFPYFKFIDGVELFFVLSGFLIGSILIKNLENKKYNPSSFLWLFWNRRWLRTLPNYYLILVLNFILVYFGLINGKIENANWHFLLFLQNFITPFTDFFWESWSLSIEEWFYVSFPIVLLSAVSIFRSVLSIKHITISIIILFILFPLCYRFAISGVEVDKFWYDVKFRKIVLTRLDSIMYGVLMAWVKYHYRTIFYKYRVFLFCIGISIIYLVILPVKETGSLFMKTIYFSLIGIGASLLLPLADSVKKFKTKFGKYIVHISLISYSMYLLNLAPIAQVIEKNFMPETTVNAAITYFIYWLTVILLSTLLYKYFEKPIMDLRKKSI